MADPLLSDEQTNFIEKASPASVLLARPGSGKTKVGVLRFLKRAQLTTFQGVAYLSFTNVAVEEATQRAAHLDRPDLLAAPNTVETLDGFIRTKIFDVFAQAHFQSIIPEIQIVEELGRYYTDVDAIEGATVFGVETYGVSARKFKPYFHSGGIGFFYEKSEFQQVKVKKNLISAILKAKHKMLFGGYARYDDIRLWSYRILQKPGLRAGEIIARRFPEILVDEAQDTTSLHRQILQVIEESGSHICYIGDPRQAIFEFGDAEGSFLETLIESRERWELTMNFRSTNKIVEVIRAHFEDPAMKWTRSCQHNQRGCFVIAASPENAVARFLQILEAAEIRASSAAVIMRTNELRRLVLGESGLDQLAPAVRSILLAWRREQNEDYELAAQGAARFLRTIILTNSGDQINHQQLRSLAWRFLRNNFPPFGSLTFADWIDSLKVAVEEFASTNQLVLRPKLGGVLRKRGLPAGRISDILSRPPTTIAVDTIHGVKGKSISGVLVIGSDRHHRDWLDLENQEMKQIGYVAFTRAEDLLVLACPTQALAEEWMQKGFTLI